MRLTKMGNVYKIYCENCGYDLAIVPETCELTEGMALKKAQHYGWKKIIRDPDVVWECPYCKVQTARIK